MAIWPATIPQSPLQDGYTESPQDGRIRSSMETGPPKVRRRFTAISNYLNCRFLMTTAEVGYFETFYNDTLLGGSDSFTWTHPRTGASITCRIQSPPQYAAAGPHWLVTLEIEVLP